MSDYPAMTINELKDECLKQIKKGNGNKKIMISADDEGNGYHGLFYSFDDKAEMIRAVDDCGLLHDNVDLEEIVLLG